MWGALTIVLLIIVIGGLIASSYVLMKKNQNMALSTVIKPFGAQFDMKNPTAPIPLVSSDGSPQITCPVGTKPNIIGAWIGVADPMGTCDPNGPIPSFVNYCSGKYGPPDASICKNGPSFKNQMCNSSSAGYKGCRTRDVSAYFAQKCKESNSNKCELTIDTTKDKWFGPYPCNSFPGDQIYDNLPISEGWSGGKSHGGSTPSPASETQGYYVHGIYTCA